jgi:spore coat protein U-like protein
MKCPIRRAGFLLVLGSGLAFLAAAGPAEAQNCSISVPKSVAFGTYDVYGAFVDTTGTVRVGCFFANNVTVDLSRGNAPSFIPRYMVNGIQHLNYNLYLDAARTTIWGDNTGGSSHSVLGTIVFRNIEITIHGRIPAGQDVTAGAYTDSITATVNF